MALPSLEEQVKAINALNVRSGAAWMQNAVLRWMIENKEELSVGLIDSLMARMEEALDKEIPLK